MKRIASVAICVLFLVSMHESSAQNAPPAEKIPNLYLFQILDAGMTLERYLERLHTNLPKLDADTNRSIDLADAEIHKKVDAATFRAEFVAHFMMFDLDGDRTVTENELRERLEYELRSYAVQRMPAAEDARLKLELKRFADADTNHDGRVTWDEAIELAKKMSEIPRPGQAAGLVSAIGHLVALAPPGKSAVTFEEIKEAAIDLFHKVDTDNNGTVSADELKAMRNRPTRK